MCLKINRDLWFYVTTEFNTPINHSTHVHTNLHCRQTHVLPVLHKKCFKLVNITNQAKSPTSIKRLGKVFSVLPLRNSDSNILITSTKLLTTCGYPVPSSSVHLIPQAMQDGAWLCTSCKIMQNSPPLLG